jgi:hypothetical protein
VILYRNPKITHMNHKKLKLINELSKIAWYEVNTKNQ